MSGKGSKPRPYSVDQKTFEDNWDKIFGKKEEYPPKWVPTKYLCSDCREVIFSSYPGEFVTCKCGNFVDQTRHYTRMGGTLDALEPQK